MGSCQSNEVVESVTDPATDKIVTPCKEVENPSESTVALTSTDSSITKACTIQRDAVSRASLTSNASEHSLYGSRPGSPAGSFKDLQDAHRLSESVSAVGLDTMIELRKSNQSSLSANVVHLEVPFGLPIEQVYNGVHDGFVLGSGISGIVRRCTHQKTGVEYAVKCLDLSLVRGEEGLEQLREEIYVMAQLDHPNIVRLEEVYESHSEIYLVQELCTGGELFDRLDEQPDYHYNEQECARLVKLMLSSVRYIHAKGIIHRDLKLENFLFSSRDTDSELKLIDFGLSKHFSFGEVQNDLVGTPHTVAPEVLSGKYDERCDIWGIGVLTYLLLSGETPFGGCGGPESMTDIRNNILNETFTFEPEDVWADVSKEAKDFIHSLLVLNPEKRATLREAQRSEWLKKWSQQRKGSANLLNPNVVKALVGFKEYSDMRKLLCEVLSFTLLPDQIRDLRKEFEKLDKEGSGEISLGALKMVLMENAGAGSLGSLKEEEIEDIFNSMRVSKNETSVHWHEFIAAGLSQCKVDDRNLRLAFDRLDSDHKGYISHNNIIDLMGSAGCASEESIRRMFLDGLKDVQCESSQITYEDFLILMKGQTKESLVNMPPLDEENTRLEMVPEVCSSSDSKNSLFSPPIRPLDVYQRQRSASYGNIENQDDDILDRRSPVPSDEVKSPLIVNRQIYRAHRQMRLAVLDASKRFEDGRAQRVLREHQMKQSNNGAERVGAGLIMRHKQKRKISLEEVRKILQKRQKEQQTLLVKARRVSGRRRKKTVSDLSGMMAVPFQQPMIVDRLSTIKAEPQNSSDPGGLCF